MVDMKENINPRKVQWRDDLGGQLEEIHKIESVKEPFFRVFWNYKLYMISEEELKKYDQEDNDSIEYMKKHIQAIRNNQNALKNWMDTLSMYPKIALSIL